MRLSKRNVVLWVFLGSVIALLMWNSAPMNAPAEHETSHEPSKWQGAAIAADRIGGVESKSLVLSVPSRPPLGEPVGVLFGYRSVEPPRTASIKASPMVSEPPMPYRFAGKVVHNGKPQFFLAKGNAVVGITEGKVLDEDYRVSGIEAERVTLVYLPSRREYHLALRQSPILPKAPLTANSGSADDTLLRDVGRWKDLSLADRVRVREAMQSMPPSPFRDRLMQEYRRAASRLPEQR